MDRKITFVASLTTLSAAVIAGSGATIVATGGSVAGAKSSDNQRWSALVGSARTATISSDEAAVNAASKGEEFKFSNDPTGPRAKGFQSSSPGASSVTTPPPGSSAPTYYTAEWATSSEAPSGTTTGGTTGTTTGGTTGTTGSTSTTSTTSTAGTTSGTTSGTTAGTTSGSTTGTTSGTTSSGGAATTGTFDPWDVHYSDVRGLGVQNFDRADLYYQTGLLAKGHGVTGLKATKSQLGNYDLDVYVTEGGHVKRLFSVGFDSAGTLNLRCSLPADTHLYLLGGNANDPGVTPYDRVHAADAVEIKGVRQLKEAVKSLLNPDGTLQRDLVFGVMRTDYQLTPSASPDDVLFSWHTDSYAQIQPTYVSSKTTAHSDMSALPVVAPIGLAALALLRRRKRA